MLRNIHQVDFMLKMLGSGFHNWKWCQYEYIYNLAGSFKYCVEQLCQCQVNVNQADIQATAIGLLHLGGLCMGILSDS